jgi:DNA polymerase (family 10)
VEKISLAGSIRRKKETIGDVDILLTSQNPPKVMNFFTELPEAERVIAKGKTKSTIVIANNLHVDLRIINKESYGAALQYFTGSKEHNIVLRKIAIEKGLKLSEYGLFKGSKMIAGKTEKEIYEKLGLVWVPPEMREDQGEIELAQKGKLPNLIGYEDIKGDLHCHSDWDGGENSIEEMVAAAEALGYEYFGIADHTKFLRIENGLNEKQLLSQNKKIKSLKSKIHVLHGCEANILKDGSIDIRDDVLAKLDYVIAGIHSSMKMKEREMTERMIKAMKNPYVDIISHPTGRILKYRDEYQIDFDKILRAAKQYNVILEINASYQRLDLNDINIKKTKEAGVKMIINTDSHHKDHLGLMEFGIAQARRGWAEKKDIINTQPLEKLLKFFK